MFPSPFTTRQVSNPKILRMTQIMNAPIIQGRTECNEYKVILLAPRGLVTLHIKNFQIIGGFWTQNLHLSQLNGFYVLDLTHQDHCEVFKHKLRTKRFIALDLQMLETLVMKAGIFDMLPKVQFPYSQILCRPSGQDSAVQKLECCHFDTVTYTVDEHTRWVNLEQKSRMISALANLWWLMCYQSPEQPLSIASTRVMQIEATFLLPSPVMIGILNAPIDRDIMLDHIIPIISGHFPGQSHHRVKSRLVDFLRFSPWIKQNQTRITLLSNDKEVEGFRWIDPSLVPRATRATIRDASNLDKFLDDLGCPLLTTSQVQALLLLNLNMPQARKLAFLGDAFLHILITWRIKDVDPGLMSPMRASLECNETLAGWFNIHKLYDNTFYAGTGQNLNDHSKGSYIEIIFGYLYELYNQMVPDFLQDRIFSILATFSKDVNKMDIYISQNKAFVAYDKEYIDSGIKPVGLRDYALETRDDHNVGLSLGSNRHVGEISVALPTLL